MERKSQNIVLVGFMGVGKSTIGKLLAERTGFHFIDTDNEIEEREKRTISEIFENRGEPYFRQIEKEVVREISSQKEAFVIATGGGVLLDRENEENLRERGTLVCLKASPEEILKRVQKEGQRPLLKGNIDLATIRKILQQRVKGYKRADMTIKTDLKSPKEISEEIWKRLGLNSGFSRVSIQVSLGNETNYPIFLGNGHLSHVGPYLAKTYRNKIAVITNPLIWKLHGKVLKKSLVHSGLKPLIIQIPDGERYKNLKWVNFVISELLKNRFERNSPILAFGGGVIGDLAGFVSGIYLRGTPFIQVPTTMIAQVDSSIGGKTGVNDPLGKNLIGVFHQPRFVWIDPELLRTLKRRDYISGLGEVIKYGMIADLRLFEFLESNQTRILDQDPEAVFHIIKRSCEIKAEVVSQDEKESGLRKILNYGHTMGHAIEAVTGYRKYRHGEAIGIGMHFAASLSSRIEECSMSLVDRQRELIRAFHLPSKLPKVSSDELIKGMALDKKVEEGKIHFILPSKIGQVVIKPIDKKIIQKEIRKFTA